MTEEEIARRLRSLPSKMRRAMQRLLSHLHACEACRSSSGPAELCIDGATLNADAAALARELGLPPPPT